MKISALAVHARKEADAKKLWMATVAIVILVTQVTDVKQVCSLI